MSPWKRYEVWRDLWHLSHNAVRSLAVVSTSSFGVDHGPMMAYSGVGHAGHITAHSSPDLLNAPSLPARVADEIMPVVMFH